MTLLIIHIYISDNLSLFLPTICSNQDLVRTLAERNPDELRLLAESLAFLSLPEDFTINSLNLTQLCLEEDKGKSHENDFII